MSLKLRNTVTDVSYVVGIGVATLFMTVAIVRFMFKELL